MKPMAMESGGRRSLPRSPEPSDGEATEAVPDTVLSLSDNEIQDKLERLTSFLSSNGYSSLPDKGKKIRVQVQQLMGEQERRRQQFVRVVTESAENCERVSRSKCAESSGSVECCLANQQVDKDSPSSFAKAFNEKFQQKEGVTICGDNTRAAGEEKCKSIIKNNSKLHVERKEKGKEKEKEKKEEKDKEKKEEGTQKQGAVSCRDVPFNPVVLISSGEKSRSVKSCNGASTHLESNSSSVPAKRKRDHDSSNSATTLKKEVVLLDIDSQTPRETSTEWEELKVYYPSPEHPEMVELSSSDMDCLGPEKYLSSTVMNFYIIYLQESGSPAGMATSNYYCFNTYFYNKLEEYASPKGNKRLTFLKLRRWWKGVNLFKKAYVFMPVHGEMHWSLVIICMPPEDDNAGPMVLHLDSLKYHRSISIFNNINKFLKEEWTFVDHNTPDRSEIPMNQRIWKNLPRRIESKAVKVPQQENEYDCGLFVLHFMEFFMRNAPERLTKEYRSKFDNKWFPTVDASALRHRISSLLKNFLDSNLENGKPESTFTEDGPCQDNRNVDVVNL